MSIITSDRLYHLLPAVYRLRDSAQGEPLRALLGLIEQEYHALELDISGLYENWFIETCAEWVVPYIGDLLGVRLLYPASPATFSARAYVAHTLDYRRRKGTAAMVETLAADVTGWPAHVVEFFELLATTQYLNHLRPQNIITPDLRDTNRLELLGGPFEQIAHTADVRHIFDGRGKYNIPSLGIFLWRLQDYFIGPITVAAGEAPRQSDARAVATPADGRYTFDPTGVTAPLFNRPQTKTDAAALADEINLPGLLRRRPLYDELEALRQAEVDGPDRPAPVYFGDNPVFQILVDGTVVPFDQVMICDTSDSSATDWRRPPATKSYTPSSGGAAVAKTIALSIDPVRGRIAFPAGAKPSSVQVSHVYGFSGDIGAGPYDRTPWLTDTNNGLGPFNSDTRWQVAVSKDLAPVPNTVFNTLAAAVQAWNSQPKGTDGVITIVDSRTYRENLTGANHIKVPEGSRLLLVAADWAALRQPGPPKSKDLDPKDLRPHVLGSIEVEGTAAASSQNPPGQLYVDGLLIEGAVTVLDGNLGILGLSHSTVVPSGGLQVQPANPAQGNNTALVVNLYRSICGPISLNVSVSALNTVDSIVAGGPKSKETDPAIDAAGSVLSIVTTTVFGTTAARILNASNSTFTGTVTAQRRQTGCVRFCYVPPGSQTARRFHCQPDLAIAAGADPTALLRLAPQFTSTDFGQPAYAQLGLRCAAEITAGAEDGSEMGAFSFLQQPQRRANLQAALDEYLRFGIEAGLIEET